MQKQKMIQIHKECLHENLSLENHKLELKDHMMADW